MFYDSSQKKWFVSCLGHNLFAQHMEPNTAGSSFMREKNGSHLKQMRASPDAAVEYMYV